MNPAELALTTATNIAKKKPVFTGAGSVSTQPIAKPSPDQNLQGTQATFNAINTATSAANTINAPKTTTVVPQKLPATGPAVDYKKSISELGTDISKGATLDEVKQAYPEFSHLDEKVLAELGTDISKGATIDEIMSAYPELQVTQNKGFVGGAKGSVAPTGGLSDGVIPQVSPVAPTTPGAYNPLKTIANAPGSLLNVGINIANMGLNPIDTVKAIAKTAIGGAVNLGEMVGETIAGKENYKKAQERLLQAEGPIGDLYRSMNANGDIAAQVGEYFKGYANPEELQRRTEEDPAGVLSDVLSIAGYAGGAIAKAGEVSKLGKVAQIGQKIASLEKYDPYTYLPKQSKVLAGKEGIVGKVMTPVSKVLNPIETNIEMLQGAREGIKTIAKKTPELYQGAKEQFARKVTGLTEDTIGALKNNKFIPEAEAGKLTRNTLVSSASQQVNQKIADLSETGRAYSQIKDSGLPIDVAGRKTNVDKILSDNNIKTNVINGKTVLDFTDSAIESKADQAKLQQVYDYFERGTVTPDIYLNKKKAIRDMTDFNQGNTDTTNRILKNIGYERKSAGHDSIPELKQLDAIYEPQINDLNEIRNKILDKDGNIREGATSYIMNSLGANRDITLQKLEKLIPEISEQVKAIKAIEDIDASKGIRPGTYNKTATIIGGAKAGYELVKGALGGDTALGQGLGLVGGVLGGIMGVFATDPAYIVDKLKGINVKLPDEIVQKINAKQTLSNQQKAKVRDILSSLDQKKQEALKQQAQKNQKRPIKLKQEGIMEKGATLPKPAIRGNVTAETGKIGISYPKVIESAKIAPKITVAPSVSAPKVDTFKRLTELDTDPSFKKITGREVLGGGKIKQGLYETEYGPIQSTFMDRTVEKVKVGDKTFNRGDVTIFEKTPIDPAKIAGEKALQELKAIEQGQGKTFASNLRAILDDFGIKKVDDIPEGSAQDILQLVRARKAPKINLNKLGKETLEQPIINETDNLVQEARKYKSADEFIDSEGDLKKLYKNKDYVIFSKSNSGGIKYTMSASEFEDRLKMFEKQGRSDKIYKDYDIIPKKDIIPQEKLDLLSESKYILDRTPPLPAKVYRGVGQKGQGTGTAKFGNGLYTSPQRKNAMQYVSEGGKLLELGSDAIPKSPISFKDFGDFENRLYYDVSKKLGYGSLKEFNKNFPDIGVVIRQMGYDGITLGPKDDMYIVKFTEQSPMFNKKEYFGNIREKANKLPPKTK